jgi:2-polyprenyl-6-methoxyphenol hydroxylase-like FAD-dependent oxidoreductase
MIEAPIVIIGGGPVGMNLALNLAAFDVRSIVLNTEPRTRWHPKGSTQNSRTMEHYRRLGLARQIRALGLPPDYPTDVGYFTRLNGWEMSRVSMPSEAEKMRHVAAAGATDQVPEPILRCNQMYVETFLFEHLKTVRAVELRFGWCAIDWEVREDGVTVEIEEVASGRRETVSGAYLVGCDGGQGEVRRKLGIRYGGESTRDQAYLGRTMVATHARAPDFYRAVRHRHCWQFWTINAEYRTNIIALNGKDEFLMNSQQDNADDAPDDAAIARRFLGSLGTEIPLDFLGHWCWTPGQALVADRFGEGRALLAGDAVHLFTPTGGFGMNTGIDDVANLGWKLAALVQGWGGPGLLASYEIERRPIARRNTNQARELTNNVGNVPVGAAIDQDNGEGAAARDAASRYLANFGEEFASLGIQLGARYDNSPIIVADNDSPPPDDPFTYRPSACPGGRAPHLWLADRTSLFDRFGRGFTLLRLRGSTEDGGALVAAARRRGVPLTILDVDEPDARDLYARDLALIRPDHHVAWRGNALPVDCAALIDRVTGHLSQAARA